VIGGRFEKRRRRRRRRKKKRGREWWGGVAEGVDGMVCACVYVCCQDGVGDSGNGGEKVVRSILRVRAGDRLLCLIPMRCLQMPISALRCLMDESSSNCMGWGGCGGVRSKTRETRALR
jgi:hypothetical protein